LHKETRITQLLLSTTGSPFTDVLLPVYFSNAYATHLTFLRGK
jgi:hypothetical protein